MRPTNRLRLSLVLALAGLAPALLLTTSQRGALAVADPGRGATLFATTFTPATGLGPLFNNTSCLSCHNTPSPGGGGPEGLSTVLRVGRLTPDGFDSMAGRGGPVARAHSVAELGETCTLMPGVPLGANVTSVRNAPPLFGDGHLDAIPDATILAGAVPQGDGILGRPNLVDGRVGRFGWKADTPSLRQFVAEAFRNELGITSPLVPSDLVPTGICGSPTPEPKASAGAVADVVAFIDRLPAPLPAAGDATVFSQIGCAACHVPSLGDVPAYSDLLLHDMGRALDDGVVQSDARGQDWRTTPLWGLSQRVRFLHDGRARTVEAAIVAHAGEAEAAVQRFRALTSTERDALLVFLGQL